VFDDSPAAKAKIERGDVIIEFNGTDIETYDDLPRRVASTPPGSSVDVIVMRNGKRKTLHTVLEKMEATEEVALTSDETEGTDWGFKARNLTADLAQQLGLSSEDQGVVVEDVETGGPAARAGMRRGDLILEANREKVGNVGDLEKALGEDDDRLVLLVQRGRSTIYLAIEQE